MKTLWHELGTVYVPGPDDSLDDLYRIRQDAGTHWAADTETTGLNQYAPGFRVRLVQVGTRDEAWILRPDFPQHKQAIIEMTADAYWHNWVFDAIALETSCNVDFDWTAEGARCTDILSRLLDPRDKHKGGTGHKLEDLGQHYLGTGSKRDAKAALMAEARRLKLGIKAETVFRDIPIDNDEYNRYAGQDVFLTARLADELVPLVATRGLDKFEAFELPLSARLAQMQRTGLAFDAGWAKAAEGGYDEALDEAEKRLIERWGVEQTASYAHTSRKSLQARLEALGVTWVRHSDKSGEPSLDAEVLAQIAVQQDDAGYLARDVLKARRAKHYGDYVRTMFTQLGTDGRLHPNIKPMQAATHRMSVTGIPVQQFPRDDPRPRGCIHADDGHVILSADYAQIEFRVGAAVSGDPIMRQDILNGVDLHAATATAMYGPDFTKQERQRAKPVGFGRLYLGTAAGIHRGMMKADPETCPSLALVKRGIAGYDRRYRGSIQWGNKLKRLVEDGNPVLVTATGRPLIVEKPWAAANYAIQSVARDIFAHGINRVWKAGLGPYLRLVVHDEVVMSVPADRAAEIKAVVQESMSTTFKGVPIVTEAAILGERWAK
jgi:DNA polymerase-1